ncbi:MAG: HAD family phosphatase [Phycisphaerales bacterium]|nr:HAD family phosphatase [Phycisphaerales bacterium]MCB9836606.1 HAD family phosphatase [Phycisphaera sp.]
MDALIFDFDGVIADSEPVHERAITRAAQMLGVPFTHDDYMTRVIGLDDRDTFRVIAEMGGLALMPERLAEVVYTKQQHVLEMIDAGEVKAFPGSIELIRSAAEVMPVAVCSGAARVEIERILRRFEILDVFRCIVTADDVEKAKPDPAGYLMTAQKLGVEPAHCVTIEDTPRGLAAAKSAGLKAVGVCHSVSAEELTQADRVVETTEQITLDMLRSL